MAYGSFVEGVASQPQILNPLFSQTDADRDLAKLMFSSLLSRDSTGAFQGDLALKFSLANDGKTIAFDLRPALRWHDGQPLTADDIVYTYQTIKRKDYSGAYAQLFQDVTVEKKGDSKIVLVSKKPSANILNLALVPIIPKHVFAKDALPFNPEFNANPIGSGPFRYSRAIFSQSGELTSIELVANKDYYRGEPYLSKFSIRFFKNSAELLEAVRRGEISGALETELAADSAGLKLNDSAQPAYLAAFFNLGNAILAKQGVREALELALDRQAMQQQFGKSFGKEIEGPTFGVSGSIPSADLALAKKKILDAKLTRYDLKLLTLNDKKFLDLADFLKTSWQKLGLAVKVKAQSKQALEQVAIPEHDFDILLFGQSFGFGADAFSFWHSSQIANGGNASSWQNKKADELLAKSRETVDAQERGKLLEQVAQLLIKNKPALFLFQPNFVYGLKPEVKGAQIANMQTASDRFAEVEKWYVKTKRVRVK